MYLTHMLEASKEQKSNMYLALAIASHIPDLTMKPLADLVFVNLYM
jgi:hypothetical protein